jgi:repressor LexA
MSTARLTPKQKQVLEFIQGYAAAHGYPPTQQEIAARFGFRSLGTVQNYLVRLEQHGLLRRSWNAKRALEVVRPPQAETLELPLLGYVAAGRPIEAVTSDDALEVPPSMVHGGENFVLRVKGDSMVEDGILDGDYVVVRRQQTANNGQTVVALVDGAATVKRFQRRAGGIELHPANAAMQPIHVSPGQEFHIDGVVVGVIRHCK